MNLIKQLFNKWFWIIILAVLVFETLSFLGYLYSPINMIFFWVIVGLILIAGLIKPEWAIYIIFAELFIGSKGYLFDFEIAGFEISIRLALFLIVFLIWLVKIIQQKKIVFLKSKLFPYFSALIVFMAVGVLMGVLGDNSIKNIFLDANGYLFLFLILPVWQFINNREKAIKLLKVFMACLVAVIIKTFVLLFIFSHGIISWMEPLYRWVRETGVGEITVLENGLARIFFQSHIFHLAGFFILLVFLVFLYKQLSKKQVFFLLLFWLGTSSVLIISYSRSFWLAWIAGIVIVYLVIWLALKVRLKKILVFGVVTFLIILAGLGLELGIINFPIIGGGAGISASSLIFERTSGLEDEAALQSRFELLAPLWQEIRGNIVLGGGFGSEVTYQTQDPRYIDMHGNDQYTTFSFEWGYLDLWLKLGFFGLLAYLLFLLKVLQTGWRSVRISAEGNDKFIALSLAMGLVVLSIVHITTPYLNHPLGIGLIIMSAVLFSALKRKNIYE